MAEPAPASGADAAADRARVLAARAPALYEELTAGLTRFRRLDDLVYAAADAAPGLLPTRAALAVEMTRDQRDKTGVEIDQGRFLAHVLADERCGTHLCHAMLLPHPRSADAAAKFAADGTLDLGAARLHRHGNAVHLTLSNPDVLNAEDETTLDATEIAVDVATLDPASDAAVIRGARLDHPKYPGRRAFGAGINLTDLYHGRIPYLWFLRRDMGYVHKLLRGVARADSRPDDLHGTAIEKPWIAAVETFAIGGHCQILLTMDYVLAAADAFLTLPARKEGIVPGLANLRLPRFTGDRLARQLIQAGRRIACDSPEGRLVCDEIVVPDAMDAAIDRVVADLTTAGPTSFLANRRAFRIGQEPLDLFRRYCAVYAREQAACVFGPAMIANLERNWPAKVAPSRRPQQDSG